MVGLAGLEPATFRPPDGRATRLRHSPNWPLHNAFAARGKQEKPYYKLSSFALDRYWTSCGHVGLPSD